MYVNDENLKIKFSAAAGDTLTILCENMGRANFGSKMMRKKGIVGRCLVGGKIHFNWNVYPLPMENPENLSFTETGAEENACFYRGTFTTEECADTFLELNSFKKGFVLINGFNIGRYWEIGPQRRLYVPASLLKKGENEVIVFESDGRKGESKVCFTDKPDLG